MRILRMALFLMGLVLAGSIHIEIENRMQNKLVLEGKGRVEKGSLIITPIVHSFISVANLGEQFARNECQRTTAFRRLQRETATFGSLKI